MPWDDAFFELLLNVKSFYWTESGLQSMEWQYDGIWTEALHKTCLWYYDEQSCTFISRLSCSKGCWEFDRSMVFVCVCVVGKVVKAEAAGAAGSCWCSGTMPEPPVALLHCFCIGHKLTPTPNTHPRYTHTLYTHTQARPAVPLSAVSTCICHAWQRWQWQSAIVALNLLHSPPPSAGDAATVWGNCWS